MKLLQNKSDFFLFFRGVGSGGKWRVGVGGCL